jgi:hypothetical protein
MIKVKATRKLIEDVEISEEEVFRALEEYVKQKLPSLNDFDFINDKNQKMVATSYCYHKNEYTYQAKGEASSEELKVTQALQIIKTLLLSSLEK